MEPRREGFPSYRAPKGSPLTVQQQELLEKLEDYFQRKKRKKRRQIKHIIEVTAAAAIILFSVWHFLIKPRLNTVSPLLTDDKLSVHFIDVGQGDSAFIEADGGMWRLTARKTIKAYLEQQLKDQIAGGEVVVML